MSNGPLQLQNAEFWTAPRRTRGDVVARISRDGFKGLLIDAPERVSLNRRTTAPVLGFFVRTLRDDLRIRQERQMLLAAVCLDTNELRIALALDAGKTPAPQAPPTGHDPGEGTTLNMFETDLRTALDVPWEPSRWRVAALLREHVSNAVTVELGREADDYEDPAVAPFVAAERAHADAPPPQSVHPAPHPQPGPGALPDYRRLPQTDPAPAAPDILLRADRVAVDRKGGTCVLRGSFRLPVARRERVGPRTPGTPAPDVGDPRATAVIPIHLVVTGSDAPGPWVVPLRVPVYGALDPHPAEACGAFAVDLFRLPEFPRNQMTYFVTAFSGAVVSGPATIAVVAERSVGA